MVKYKNCKLSLIYRLSKYDFFNINLKYSNNLVLKKFIFRIRY